MYKYKLLFIYFAPYESSGRFWRLTFTRLVWALVIFQIFMTGLFSLRGQFFATIAMVPAILYSTWWGWYMIREFEGLSKFMALSSICEVERGGNAESVVGLQEGVVGDGSRKEPAKGLVARSQTCVRWQIVSVKLIASGLSTGADMPTMTRRCLCFLPHDTPTTASPRWPTFTTVC